MAQTVHANETDPTLDSVNESTPSPITDFTAWATLVERLVQDEVRRRIDLNHTAGRPVYFGGTGVESGMVFESRPNGRAVQVRVLADGSLEEIG